MKVAWTKVVTNFDGQLVYRIGEVYSGPWAGLKNDDKKKAEANAANQAEIAKQNQTMMLKLNSMFDEQFKGQDAILGKLQDHFQSILDNPQGYSNAEITSMRTGASDTIARQGLDAQRQIQNQAFILGGRSIPSGLLLKNLAGLQGAKLQAESQAQGGITLQDAEVRRQQQAAAAQGLMGIAAAKNPLAYATAAQGFSGQANTADSGSTQSLLAAKQLGGSTFGKILGSVLGGVGSSLLPGVGSILSGGFGSLFGGPKSLGSGSSGMTRDNQGIET